MEHHPRVSIVVGSFNSLTTIYRRRPLVDILMDGIHRSTYHSYNIVIVDGCSTDGSVPYIQERFKDVDLLKDRENYGLARSNNGGIMFAIKHYNPDYILSINDDLIIKDKRWIDKLVDVAESDKAVGIVGCKLTYPNGRIQHAGISGLLTSRNIGRGQKDMHQFNRKVEMEAVSGAVFLIKREVVDAIGLFDANFMIGFDEEDYCIRARRAGFKVVYDGGLSITHLEGSTSTLNNRKREGLVYRRQKNYIYFAMKDFPICFKLLAPFVAIANSVISIETKDRPRALTGIRLKDKPISRLIGGIKGIVAGYRLYYFTKRVDYVPGQCVVISRARIPTSK
ncbi:MAG: glycosyltransferase family 2 protein [Candidatus Micrarchaeota archaeon]|nr:glycosyltransferase family 2 protein [Candidatus Micrarchaeota archaeon]